VAFLLCVSEVSLALRFYQEHQFLYRIAPGWQN
jgi:hypothetical protein